MLHTLSTDVADNVRFTVFNIYQAESRSYREQYLEQASIFINRLDRLPGNVEEVLRFVAGQHPLRQSDYGSPEAIWMDLNNKVFATLTEEKLFSICKDMPWNAPPGPIPADARPLSVPKPDIGLGLKVLSKLHYQQAKATIDMREAVLSAPVLTDLNSNSTIRLVASPSPGLAKMAFPFLVYEAKSDSSSMFFAENQVAGGAAKCLALQRQVWHPSMASPPLSFAICSQGALWEVFLSFFDNQSESYHLTRIGRPLFIEDDLDNLQLQLMLERIRTWATQTYRTAIIDALTRLSSAQHSSLASPCEPSTRHAFDAQAG